nr:hypothetical protein TorRG33x02_097470 [Ipomoea batatas]
MTLTLTLPKFHSTRGFNGAAGVFVYLSRRRFPVSHHRLPPESQLQFNIALILRLRQRRLHRLHGRAVGIAALSAAALLVGVLAQPRVPAGGPHRILLLLVTPAPHHSRRVVHVRRPRPLLRLPRRRSLEPPPRLNLVEIAGAGAGDLLFGHVADVARLERRAHGAGGGVRGQLRDRRAAENGLHRRLTQLPVYPTHQKLYFIRKYNISITRAEVFRAGVDEVEEAGAAVEFGEEDGGVGLGVGGFDPLEARLNGAFFTATFPENPASVTAHPHS